MARKESKAWRLLSKQSFKDQAKNRDVHSTQNLERGEMGEVKKPVKEYILSTFLALLFAVLGYIAGYIVSLGFGFYEYIVASDGGSFLDFNPADVQVSLDWKIWAWTAFVFLIAFLAFSQRMLMSHKAKNSMVETTDINTYENDQKIMLVEEIVRNYDIFPDAGAHASGPVSSMLSHVMISRKGLKSVPVTKRYKKTEGDNIKGAPIVNDDGTYQFETKPIIDEAFGQDLFTASGIPVDEKEIRKPMLVTGIDYNKKDSSGARRDRDKLDYDTIADVINGDWELPEYEVQRPAGGYLIDTAPVNTMVLAITRAGKGNFTLSY